MMSSRSKRLTAAALAAAMAFSLASCGGSDSSSAAAESTGSQASDSQEETPSDGKYARNPVVTEPVVEKQPDLDLAEVQNETDVPEDFQLTLEAEDAAAGGRAKALANDTLGEYTGEGFVAVPTEDSAVEFSFELETAGTYDLVFYTANSGTDASASVALDGEDFAVLPVSEKEFTLNSLNKVELSEGSHTVTFTGGKAMIFLDRLEVAGAKALDLSAFTVKETLADKNASEETQRLYAFLKDVYGKYTISGQYSGDNMGPNCMENYVIKKATGKEPAILGLDLAELSPSLVNNGSTGGQKVPEYALDWWNNYGGIVTFCWHWNAPEPYIGIDGKDIYKGFYADSTTFDLGKALSKEDQQGYDLLIRDIDAIAETLAYLDDQHVPILFRPLHEGGGDPKWNNPWFWWGTSGAKAYIELWQLMFDRLTNYHNIHNLIWVWNGQIPDYYPGDEYVDVIGFDIYASKGDTSPQTEIWEMMRGVTEENKIIALTENGVVPDPEQLYSTTTRWAWFATWNGEFAVNMTELGVSDYTPEEKLVKFYNSERVLTLDELPDLKSYPIAGAAK